MIEDPAFRPHDHARCRTRLLANARHRAAAEGLRLTPVRKQVLDILAETHRPLGAYDVLERLTAAGHPYQPPIAYRALDFLCAHGLAHRIERLSAFTACRLPGVAHVPSFLICRACGNVAETAPDALGGAIAHMAGDCGFAADPAGVEVTGICQPCALGQDGDEAGAAAAPPATATGPRA